MVLPLVAIGTIGGYAVVAWLGAWPIARVPLRGLIPLLLFLSLPSLLLAGLWERIPLRRAHLWTVLGVGIAVRLFFIGHDPYLSDDVYRYLWDGRVQLAGHSPYGVAPAAADLADVEAGWPATTRVRERVNHPEIVTVYPALLEGVFLGVAAVGGGLGVWRLFLLAVEVGIFYWLIRGLRVRCLDPRLAALYFWHPLAVLETAWSAHAESVAVLLLLMAVVLLVEGRNRAAGLVLGLGGAAKFLPFGLLPYLWRRAGVKPVLAGIGVAALLGLPYVAGFVEGALGGLFTYAETWYFNDILFRPLGWILGLDVQDKTLVGTKLLRGALPVAWLLLCVAVAWRRPDPVRAALWIAGGFVILTPTLHPWYLLWVLPFAILERHRAWLLLTVLVLLSYWVKYVEGELGVWRELWPVRAMEFLPPLALAAVERWRRPRVSDVA